MTRILSFFTIILLCTSCKKTIQEQQQSIVMKAITDGKWKVEYYMDGTTDISAQFTGFQFKFYEDGTVIGTDGTITNVGTWSGNVSNYSITSFFQSANPPVFKLNGIWKLTDSYWDYVEAEMSTDTGKSLLHLRKIP